MTKKKAEVHIEGTTITCMPESDFANQRRVEAVIKLADAIKSTAEALKGPDTYGIYIGK